MSEIDRGWRILLVYINIMLTVSSNVSIRERPLATARLYRRPPSLRKNREKRLVCTQATGLLAAVISPFMSLISAPSSPWYAWCVKGRPHHQRNVPCYLWPLVWVLWFDHWKKDVGVKANGLTSQPNDVIIWEDLKSQPALYCQFSKTLGAGPAGIQPITSRSADWRSPNWTNRLSKQTELYY